LSLPAETASLRRTPLYDLHVARGARMVPFAGYEMPVQYPPGIIAEHLHTRAKAGLFDVSHMGQIRLRGAATARALEALVPGDLQSLAPSRMRYTLLLNEQGGILDDLMATRTDDGLMLVVNAARKNEDLAHLQAHLDAAIVIEPQFERALLALQGPAVAAVLARFARDVERMPFMSAADLTLGGIAAGVTRSGYTGEDGFEISLAAADAPVLAERLLAEPEVLPIGLGARDTLRLEARFSLYGNDIDETTNPIEAGLGWTTKLDKPFVGRDAIVAAKERGPTRRIAGLEVTGGVARHGHDVVKDSTVVGRVTSGTFGPTVQKNIALAYIPTELAKVGTDLAVRIRDKDIPAKVVKTPFYKRSG
jgi:aminomethyltransferase